jgi:aminoglycoside phosphotransferase (APT) family kinase protein
MAVARLSDTDTSVNIGARLVTPAQPLDTGRLQDFLHKVLGTAARVQGIRQFQGGQSNPTYRVTVGVEHFILRRKPSGPLLPSAHAIEREYRVMAALANTDVPVPRMVALCEDDAILGTPFFVMEYVEGRVLWDPTLPGMTREARAAYYDELNRVLAALHLVDIDRVGLADFGRHGQYIERQVGRWSKQYAAAGIAPIPAMDRLIEWLPHHIPPGDETSIVHGDYRLDNVIFHPTAPRVLAVLDWELSTLGHPLSDLAYQVMAWRLTAGQFRGIADADLPALGIPAERDYVAAYCRRTGRSGVPHFEFYLIFNMFRIAAILHGVLARAQHGNAASDDAIATGSRARLVADVAWAMAQNADH